MTANFSPRISLPKIVDFRLVDFDLYKREPNAHIEINRDVFCLIGANGLGKSTFLNTILYALTGGLPARARAFASPHEYAIEATRKDRREDYYDGRVEEDSRETSSISLSLSWPNLTMRLVRPFFGTGELSQLEVNGESNLAEEDDSSECEERYRNTLLQQTGLKDFDQFVFLMHFVCSFDEDRHLLLWEPSALTHALYLAFGSDLDEANRANALRREVEKSSSRARNRAFAARKSMDSARELIQALSSEDDYDEATHVQFVRLNNILDEAIERIHRKDIELRKTEAEVSDISAILAELKIEYDEVFSSRASGCSSSRHHPLIRSTLSSGVCAVCRTDGVSALIQEKLDGHLCPLCGSGDSSSTRMENELIEELRSLDGKIEETRALLDEALKKRRRLRDEIESATQSEAAARKEREVFLEDNPDIQASVPSSEGVEAVNVQIRRHKEEAERFKSESRRHYAERDKARKELLKIEKEFKKRYEETSDDFVDLFRKYAEEFIGLPVDIELVHRSGANDTGFELTLNLNGVTRVASSDVSESQRFFLDIALRMAVLEFVAPGMATILIDTPEGSLDISYEARAGSMFSQFSKSAGSIIMTANLRSSALVERLAQTCKSQGMQIEKMTDWTDLSEVQREEEELFARAYDQIEKALV